MKFRKTIRVVCFALALTGALPLMALVQNPQVIPTGVPAFKGRSDVVIAHVEFESSYSGCNTLMLPVGNMKDIKEIRVNGIAGTTWKQPDGMVCFSFCVPKGRTRYPLTVELSPCADVSRKLVIGGKEFRVGSVVARAGQEIVDTRDSAGYPRRSRNFRIPGIVKTPKGTLVACFDIRYNTADDLPNDITVGVSRSTDGGNTWSPIMTAIDWRGLPGGDGVGDAAILVDPSNGRVWILGVRQQDAKEGSMIWTSRTGTVSPGKDGCGQLYLVHSDDDGKTWSPVRNVTADLKRLGDPDTKDWGVVFHGPGAGFTLADGTLVFPAQCWGDKGRKFEGHSGRRGLLFYSKDHGETWTSSKEMIYGGSESTGVQLSDGSIWMNVREGTPASRTSAVTRDLGETWELHASAPLNQPKFICQAAALAMNGKIYFSNPVGEARGNMTLRVSADDAKTWSKGVVYDPRMNFGYSSLCPVDDKTIGVFYEGEADCLYFLAIPLDEIDG